MKFVSKFAEDRVMKLHEFNLRTQEEKLDLLYYEGIYIGKQKKEGLFYLLYQLEGFYVELVYKKYRCTIKCIYCFSGTSFLDPYLEQIDIAVLV